MNTLTKNFKLVKQALIENVLGPHIDNFELVGYQRQTRDAKDIAEKRLVTIYFSGAQIPKGSKPNKGDFQHDLRFQLDITVALPSKVDLTVFEKPGATAAQKAFALDNALEAAALADEEVDDIYGTLLTILKDTRNSNLGIEKSILIVANLDVNQFEKNDPVDEGGLVIVTGSLLLNCRVVENVSSPDGILSNKTIAGTLKMNQDPVQKTGIKNNTL